MRIRSIKPEFWRSDDITALSLEDRLLFIGLWSYVDDNGVGLDKEPSIAADLFAGDLYRNPRETFARLSRGLQNLSEANLIVRYRVDGKRYLAVVTWEKHQRIDKPNKPRFPQYDAIRDTLATPSRDSRETPATGTGEQGTRGSGEQVTTLSDPDGSDPTDYPADFLKFWTIYPRREKKRPAATAFKRAKKRATVIDIIHGAQEYRDDPNREQQYTKLPTTWLDGDCWDDDPLPERRDNVRHLSRNDQTMLGELEWALNQEQQQRLEIEA